MPRFLETRNGAFFVQISWISACTFHTEFVPFTGVTTMEIRLGDCTEGMRRLAEGSVDVAVTSPPYNLGIAYRSYVDSRPREEYLLWCEEWAMEIHRLLHDEGSLFLNLGTSGPEPTLPFEIVLRLVSGGFHLQNTIHWVKSISLEMEDGSILSRGHFKPIQSKRYLNNCHEYIFHLTKAGNSLIDRRAVGVPYADKSNIARWRHSGGNDRRCRGNVWFIPYETIRDREWQRPHPATFPVELAERCILLHGCKDAVVMDPFLGLGATALAASRVKAVRFIGFELDREYAEFSAKRVGASLQYEG
jgi:site-specific DNA-methyltransferase (adenine-specific)